MNQLNNILISQKDTIVTIVNKYINPIVTIVDLNNSKTVDILLEECHDLIDKQYTPWFAKKFYSLDKNSVLAGASIARKDAKNAQRFFSYLIKTATK